MWKKYVIVTRVNDALRNEIVATVVIPDSSRHDL
jgi:hypothetical protein